MNGLKFMITLSNTEDLDSLKHIIAFNGQSALGVAIHIMTVLILFALLAKILFNPVREILRKRREEIANEYKEIEDAKSTANTLIKDYEYKIANIDQEATEILEKARKTALHQENKILKQAKEEAEKIKEIAYIEIEREKAAAKDDMRKEIIEVASLMANKFVQSSIDDATKTALLDKTLDEMGENTWLN